jgi:Nif-specific regulatory protein
MLHLLSIEITFPAQHIRRAYTVRGEIVPTIMTPRLVAITGPHGGRIFEIASDPFVLGRRSQSDLQLDDVAASRRHCALEPTDGGLRVRDLGSRHGTFVNGIPVRERDLAHGDLLEAAGSLFLVLLHDAPGEDGAPAGGDRGSGVRLDESDVVADSTLHLPAMAGGREGAARHLVPTAASAAQLRALLSLAAAVQASRGVRPLARRVVELVREVLPAERAAVLLSDRPGGALEVVEAVGSGSDGGEVTVSRRLVEAALSKGQTVLVHGLRQIRALADDGSGEPSGLAILASVACAPVMTGGSALGVLYADSSDPRVVFSSIHAELLAAVAAITGAGLEQARRVEWLEGERSRLQASELEHDLVGEHPA